MVDADGLCIHQMEIHLKFCKQHMMTVLHVHGDLNDSIPTKLIVDMLDIEIF